MKLVIFGANGRVGNSVSRQAAEAGHDVTAVVRRELKIKLPHPRISWVQLNAVTPEQILEVVRGADAVISAIGPRIMVKNNHEVSDVMREIIQGLQLSGVNRLVTLGTAALTPLPDGRMRGDVVIPPFFQNAYIDHRGVLEALQNSQLDWTCVCPPGIPDGPVTGRYRVAIEDFPVRGSQLTAGDAAHSLLSSLTRQDLCRKRVGVAY